MMNFKRKRNFFILWMTQILGVGALVGITSILPLYTIQLGIINAEEVAVWSGILISAVFFGAILSHLYKRSLGDYPQSKSMIEKNIFVYGLSIICIAFVSDVYQLFLFQVIQGFCGGLSINIMKLAASMALAKEQLVIESAFRAALIIAGIFGPVIVGAVVSAFGYQHLFIIVGSLCLMSRWVIHVLIKE